MSYIEQNLTSSENIIANAELSWWSQLGWILIGILLLPIGIGLILFIVAFINIKSTEMALTTKRIIAKTGFIKRSTVELRNNKIESIIVEQGMLGRIFNFGSIIVKGTGGVGTPIPYIKNPLGFRKVVNELVDEIHD